MLTTSLPLRTILAATLASLAIAALPACAADGGDATSDDDATAVSEDAYKVSNADALCGPWKAYVSPGGHSFYFLCRRNFYQEPDQDGSKWRAAATCCTEAGCRKVVGTLQPYADNVTLRSVGTCSGYVSNVRMEYFPHECFFGGCPRAGLP